MNATLTLHCSTLASPLGDLLALWTDDGLRALNFADSVPASLAGGRGCVAPVPAEAEAPAWLREPLDNYWAGDLDALRRIPCDTDGTPFQRAVWSALLTIPAGETRSYGALAAQIGHPTAARAVGAANGANPVSLVVPCHRAIGSSGALTGYAHGLERKRWLLRHEGVEVASPSER